MAKNTMSAVQAATYCHETMSEAAFEECVRLATNHRSIEGIRMIEHFCLLEYMNSPLGLIVYAHYEWNGCVAFYPASVDFEKNTGLKPFHDDVKPIGNGTRFGQHNVGRRGTGLLVHSAYGRMIEAGDPEAPNFGKDFTTLRVFDTPKGLFVAAVMRDEAYVIRPVGGAAKKEAA